MFALGVSFLYGLAVAAAAVAAPRLNGHVYEGTMHHGALGKVVFQVGRDGKTMQFTGRASFATACRKNGRSTGRYEAVVVAHRQKHDTSSTVAPLVNIKSNGKFYGAGSQRVTRGRSRGATLRYHFAGHFTGSGNSAVGRFYINNCASSLFRASLVVPQSRVALAATSGLVAAYGFNEGSGATVADASGNGNNGTISNATWSTAGKFGDALSFNGTSSVVTIPNSASLQLSSGMTLEAWVNPSTVNATWRDVIYKGNDNFYLEAMSTNSSRPDAGSRPEPPNLLVGERGVEAVVAWSARKDRPDLEHLFIAHREYDVVKVDRIRCVTAGQANPVAQFRSEVGHAVR